MHTIAGLRAYIMSVTYDASNWNINLLCYFIDLIHILQIFVTNIAYLFFSFTSALEVELICDCIDLLCHTLNQVVYIPALCKLNN